MPLEDHAIEELTANEMRELLRRQKVRSLLTASVSDAAVNGVSRQRGMKSDDGKPIKKEFKRERCGSEDGENDSEVEFVECRRKKARRSKGADSQVIDLSDDG